MIGLLGRKLGMTEIFDEGGRRIPVTVLEVGPCVVTEIRTKEKHGYNAVQLGFGSKKEARASKPELGHFKKNNLAPMRFVSEIRTESVGDLKIGDTLFSDQFEVGDDVDVSGISIGKGFQGVVKRHHFKGGPKSHGAMFGRVPGSIGASSFPSRVLKGLRAAGHMGHDRVTVQNLRVVHVDRQHHLICVEGAVPGKPKSYVIVKESLKKPKHKSWRVNQPSAPGEEPQTVQEKPLERVPKVEST